MVVRIHVLPRKKGECLHASDSNDSRFVPQHLGGTLKSIGQKALLRKPRLLQTGCDLLVCRGSLSVGDRATPQCQDDTDGNPERETQVAQRGACRFTLGEIVPEVMSEAN